MLTGQHHALERSDHQFEKWGSQTKLGSVQSNTQHTAARPELKMGTFQQERKIPKQPSVYFPENIFPWAFLFALLLVVVVF